MIGDFLSIMYPWLKSLHVIAVISWMAGIFYLPRLLVHHAENGESADVDALFKSMEFKLLKVIMNPAMFATWVFGLCLVFTPGMVDWSYIWPWSKAICVLGMTWFHHWLGRRRKDFAAGKNVLSGKTYRIMNEVPTVLMIIIVVSVIARPF